KVSRRLRPGFRSTRHATFLWNKRYISEVVKPMKTTTRREFIGSTTKTAIALVGSTALFKAPELHAGEKIPVPGHLWVYASRFPPPFDCSPVLEEVFRDFQDAGMDGL